MDGCEVDGGVIDGVGVGVGVSVSDNRHLFHGLHVVQGALRVPQTEAQLRVRGERKAGQGTVMVARHQAATPGRQGRNNGSSMYMYRAMEWNG